MSPDLAEKMNSHHVSRERKPSANSELIGRVLEGEVPPEVLNLPEEKDVFLGALEIYKIDNNLSPAEILESYHGDNLKEVLGLCYDRIDQESLYYLEKALLKSKAHSEETMSEKDFQAVTNFNTNIFKNLLVEAGPKEKPKGTEAKYRAQIKPGTADLAKIALSDNEEILERAARGILSGRFKVTGEDLTAEGEKAKHDLGEIRHTSLESLRSELMAEKKAEILARPDTLITKSEQKLIELKSGKEKARYLENHAENLLMSGASDLPKDTWSNLEYEIVSLEGYLSLYREEKEAVAESKAELAVWAVEAGAKVDPLELRTSGFEIADLATDFERKVELARDNKYGEILGKYTGHHLEKAGTIARNHEKELSEKDLEKISAGIRKAIENDIAERTTHKMSDAEERELTDLFFETSVHFERLVFTAAEIQELLDEMKGLVDENGSENMIRHILSEIDHLSKVKDQTHLQAMDEYAHLRCDYKQEKLINDLTQNRQEIESAEKHLKKEGYRSVKEELHIEVPHGTIQTPEVLKVDAEELRHSREEYIFAVAEYSRVRAVKENVKKLKVFLHRAFGIHK